jgi:hypothetical protein
VSGRRFNPEGVQHASRQTGQGRVASGPVVSKDVVAQKQKLAYARATRPEKAAPKRAAKADAAKAAPAKTPPEMATPAKPGGRNTPLCRDCGADGHYALDCKAKPARGRVRLPLSSCSSCNLRRHSGSRSAVQAVIYAYELLVAYGFDREAALAANDAEARAMEAFGGSGVWRDHVRSELELTERTEAEASQMWMARATRTAPFAPGAA